MINHILPSVNFQKPEYGRDLLVGAREDEHKAGEKYAAYCDWTYKFKKTEEEVAMDLLSIGIFDRKTAALRNARKVLLLGGSIANRQLLEKLRAGEIPFLLALWQVKDPRKVVKVEFKKDTESEILEKAKIKIKEGILLYWSIRPKNISDSLVWIRSILSRTK